MVSHVLFASYDQARDAIVAKLREKRYEYVTHPMLFPGYGLWYVRATGPPITALTIEFDNEDVKKRLNAGFVATEGKWPFPLVNKSAVILYRASKIKRTKFAPMAEVRARERERERESRRGSGSPASRGATSGASR